jgi:hypothetical protein
VISIVGVAALSSFMTEQCAREIGIRKALGAHRVRTFLCEAFMATAIPIRHRDERWAFSPRHSAYERRCTSHQSRRVVHSDPVVALRHE